VVVGTAGLLAAAPYMLAPDAIATLTRIVVFALLAASLDLLVGYTGLPSLGHAAHFGVGAYAAGLIAIHVSANGPLQVLVATAAGAAAAALTGWVAVRSRGTYFLMLTLAIGQLYYQLAVSWTGVTGGSNGLYGIPSVRVVPGGEPILIAGHLYWYVLACATVAFAALAAIVRSPFGLSLRGVRDNEARMRAVGYDPARYAYAAYCLAGAVAGTAGALFVAQQRLVTPNDLGFTPAALVLLAVVLGGAGSLWGPCLGAAVVVLVRDELGVRLDGHGALLLGIVFVVAVYLLPRGFAGLPLAKRRRP
jgi:branched-chain amino acid transport system permease protein